MSNDKPYTINVEVPTDSIAREETREVSDILVSGLADLFNRISQGLRSIHTKHNNINRDLELLDDAIDVEFEENYPCDKDDSVIYHDSDKHNN